MAFPPTLFRSVNTLRYRPVYITFPQTLLLWSLFADGAWSSRTRHTVKKRTAGGSSYSGTECLRPTTCDRAHAILQILCFKNLMKRNREKLASTGAPPQNSAISLPFIVVNTSKKTTIDCSISSDKCVDVQRGRGLIHLGSGVCTCFRNATVVFIFPTSASGGILLIYCVPLQV